MGLFDLFGEILTAPIRIAATTVKATVRTTGAVLALDPDKVAEVIEDATDEVKTVVEDVSDSVDK